MNFDQKFIAPEHRPDSAGEAACTAEKRCNILFGACAAARVSNSVSNAFATAIEPATKRPAAARVPPPA